VFRIFPGQPGQVGSDAARVTSDANLASSASIASGAMPKMIVCFKLTCHQSSAKEALFIGSNTTPSVLFVEVFGLRVVFPPIVIGSLPPHSFGSLYLSLGGARPVGLPQRAGSSGPGAVTPGVCGWVSPLRLGGRK